VLLGLVVGVVGTTWGMLRALEAEAAAVSEARLKEAALTAAQRSGREARESLRLSLYEQARARRFSRQMGQRLDSLAALTRAAQLRKDDRLRDEAIAAMALPDLRFGPSWHGLPPGFQTWAFDGDSKLYARISGQGVISVRTLPDNREIRSIAAAPTKTVGVQAARGLMLSPDGRYVARHQDDYVLRVWRVADGQPVLRQEPSQVWVWNFSTDSRQLVVGQNGWVVRFDLGTGQELNRWELPRQTQASYLAFHPDNRRLAVGYRSWDHASVYDVTTGKP